MASESYRRTRRDLHTPCFNEAEATWPRNPGLFGRKGVVLWASMRPRPRGLGICRWRLPDRPACGGFNEAEATWPRNLGDGPIERGIIRASMRPRPRGLGILIGRAAALQVARASMRPRPRGLGILEAGEQVSVGPGASMRPRPRGLGIRREQCPCGPACSERFNEAEATWPRNRELLFGKVAGNRRASMRPRPRGLGITTSPAPSGAWEGGFNEAEATWPRNLKQSVKVAVDNYALQ